MKYHFPIAFLFNASAITFLIIALGLSGESEMAAEVAVIHGATLALFFAFSANARSIILSSNSVLGAYELLRVRQFLVPPLAVIAFYLVDYVIEINAVLAIFIIIRRALDWITEIQLSEMERTDDKSHVSTYIKIQAFLLIAALAWLLVGTYYPMAGIFVWCLSPILVQRKIYGSNNINRVSIKDFRDLLLPHLGSTAIIGISVYVFRVIIILMVGKAFAGDLFTAFSIGGVIGSVFATSIGPSIVLREQNSETAGLPLSIKTMVGITALLGVVLVLFSINGSDMFHFMGKSSEFWLALGLSMIGGTVMVAAQIVRLRIIQLGKAENVFGADVLMNIILLAVIPYAYYLLGRESLTFLYLFGAILAYVFYRSSDSGIGVFVGAKAGKFSRALIAFMLILPMFFLLDGTIFAEKNLYHYESQGNIFALPLPVTIAACFLGIMLVGRYRFAHISLAVIFVTFVLMTISTLLSSPDMNISTKGKFILLMQFILPYFALVLGQIFEGREERQVIEKTFLIVLLLVIPAQVILTIIHPVPILTPYIGFFSIYQHLQYVPVIFVSAYLLVLFSLYRIKYYSVPLLFLSMFMGAYVGAASSRLAIALLIGGIGLFIAYSWSDIKKKLLVTLVGIVIAISPFLYMYTYGGSGYFNEKFSIGSAWPGKAEVSEISSIHVERTGKDKMYGNAPQNPVISSTDPSARDRKEYWRFYANNIVESSSTLLWGHTGRPDRSNYPSAHNYYLDYAYHFGIIALFPLLYLCAYTIKSIYINRRYILSKPIIGIAFITLFFILVDSTLKVGFRQPYPGMYMFFIWGVLLSRLHVIRSTYPQRMQG